MITLGVLKETKPAEGRVALVPEDARRLRATGARILIEEAAGARAGFSDRQYLEAGAASIGAPEPLISSSDIVIKVKEPTLFEIEQLRPHQLYLSFLHLAAFPHLIEPLARSGVAAIGYETIAVDGQHPVLRPMSEVAGALALQVGEHYLEATNGGRGVLLPGIHGKEPGKMVVIGSGVVGEACARLAYGEGIRVVFVDANPARLQQLALDYPGASFLGPDPDRLSSELDDADLLVGAVYINGARAPRVVSRAQIGRMPERSVAVDVAIDQGGCFETSHPTTHESPIYTEAGVLHYCVTNIPAMVPHSASVALSHALAPFLERVLRDGIEASTHDDSTLGRAINIRGGRVVLPTLLESAAAS